MLDKTKLYDFDQQTNDEEKIYQAIKTGKVTFEQLSPKGKQYLKSYMDRKNTMSTPKYIPQTNQITLPQSNLPRERTTREGAPQDSVGNALLGGLMTGITFGAGADKLRESTKHDISATIGELAGSIAPIGRLYKGANLLTKPITNQLGKIATTGALTGAGLGLGKGVLEQKPIKEIGKETALYAGMGAVLDPAIEKLALPLAKKGFTKTVDALIKRFDKNKLTRQQLEQQLKGLEERILNIQKAEEGQKLLNQNYKRPKPITQLDDELAKEINDNAGITGGYKPLYEDKSINVPNIDINRSTSKYKTFNESNAQLQDLFNLARKKGVSVGREYEDLQSLWGNISPYEETRTLDQLIEDSTIPPTKIKEMLEQIPKNEINPNISKTIKTKQVPTIQEPNFEMRGGALVPVTPNQQLEQLAKQQAELSNQLNNLGTGNKVLDLLSGLKPKTTTETVNLPKIEGIQSSKKVITPKVNEPLNVSELKDISGFKGYTQDIYRNFRDVFGKQFNKVKPILDNFDNSKKEYVELQEGYLNDLKTEIVDKLGIKKGSKESALVQKFGEGGTEYFDKKTGKMVKKEYTLEDLKKDAPNKWQDIVKANEWFRNKYDELIDQVNKTVAEIYPNNPEKLVPKRDNYYRHFRELEGFEGIRNLFDTPAGIDPSLWASFKQQRGLGEYKQDAVGGFLNYVPAASYSVKIDPHIKNFNQFKEQIVNLSKESGKDLTNFLQFLDDYSRDLSGKTNPMFDRSFIKIFGRDKLRTIDWMNKRVKSNVILGNVGSALSQLANIPNGLAFAKQHSIKGAGRALNSIFDDSLIKQSGFLKERYGSNIFNQFDTRIIDQPKKLASWMLETADRIGTTFIWNSAYEKALAEKIGNPIKYADDMTRDLVAGRGIGEVPLIQKSKIFQVIAPFQLEVANLWRVQKDFIKNKDFGGLATLFLANAMFNKAMEEIRGSGVVFDPINAMIEASEEGLTPLERGGRVAGEVLSNIPLGQTLASQYPEYGFNFYGTEMPTRKELFGRNDPTRFGTGLAGVLTKGFQDPVTKIVLPFGGLQIEKTAKGAKALYNEGVYNDKNILGNDLSQLKYPVEQNTPNLLKGLLFGASAFPEVREYYEQENRPLSEKQTLQYQNADDKGKFYNYIQFKRDYDNLTRKINEVKKDRELTKRQKEEEIRMLIKKLKELKGGK